MSIENLDKRGKDFHLDHIFSIKMGFCFDIKPEIIGHLTNLRIISAQENLSKGQICAKVLHIY